jgi:hypothetical protein
MLFIAITRYYYYAAVIFGFSADTPLADSRCQLSLSAMRIYITISPRRLLSAPAAEGRRQLIFIFYAADSRNRLRQPPIRHIVALHRIFMTATGQPRYAALLAAAADRGARCLLLPRYCAIILLFTLSR